MLAILVLGLAYTFRRFTFNLTKIKNLERSFVATPISLLPCGTCDFYSCGFSRFEKVRGWQHHRVRFLCALDYPCNRKQMNWISTQASFSFLQILLLKSRLYLPMSV